MSRPKHISGPRKGLFMSNEEVRLIGKTSKPPNRGNRIPQPDYEPGSLTAQGIETALQRMAQQQAEPAFPQTNAEAFQDGRDPVNWGDRIEIARDEIQKDLATPTFHNRRQSSVYYPRTIKALDWSWSMIVHTAALVFIVYFALTAFELVPLFAQLMDEFVVFLRSLTS